MAQSPKIEGSVYRYRDTTYKIKLDMPFVLNYPVKGLVEKFAGSQNKEVFVKTSLLARLVLGLNADKFGYVPLKQTLCKIEDFQIAFERFHKVKEPSSKKPSFVFFRQARNLFDYIKLAAAEWPEPVGPRQLGGVDPQIADMITELITILGVKHDAAILDVGAYDNSLVERLFANGFRNALGIDVDPLIKISKLGRMMNFRDLDPKEKYDVILSFMTLDYYPGGMGGAKAPSLDVLVDKYCQHIKPGGFLIMEDSAANYLEFIAILESSGFKRVELPKISLSYINISQSEKDRFTRDYWPKLYKVWQRQ